MKGLIVAECRVATFKAITTLIIFTALHLFPKIQLVSATIKDQR